jgi:Ca-activated chloride channel family protein
VTFQNLWWLYVAVPALYLMAALSFWRRHFWGHSLVEQLRDEIGILNPVLRLPKILEGLAVGFLLIALLGPVYPFTLNRIERGGLQILFVLDLSQSMEEGARSRSANPAPRQPQVTNVPPQAPPGPAGPLVTPGSKMEAVKLAAMEFIKQRQGDAMGLAVFSNNGYLVTPPAFDSDSLSQYLRMTNSQSLVNEGFTAIGEGLAVANQFFEQQRQRNRQRGKGNIIILLTDGDNNYGRDPLTEIERARSDGTRIYMVSVQIEPGGTATEIANAVPSTGGKAYDAQNRESLSAALRDINEVEKGVFFNSWNLGSRASVETISVYGKRT